MASAPQPNLPLFFNDLMPLNSKDHANYRSRPMTKAPWLAKQHAVPLTVDEFVQAQRDMPIVFSTGPEAVPLALMGLNDGVNTFVDEEGTVTEQVYIPAYVRRYPFSGKGAEPSSQSSRRSRLLPWWEREGLPLMACGWQTCLVESSPRRAGPW